MRIKTSLAQALRQRVSQRQEQRQAGSILVLTLLAVAAIMGAFFYVATIGGRIVENTRTRTAADAAALAAATVKARSLNYAAFTLEASSILLPLADVAQNLATVESQNQNYAACAAMKLISGMESQSQACISHVISTAANSQQEYTVLSEILNGLSSIAVGIDLVGTLWAESVALQTVQHDVYKSGQRAIDQVAIYPGITNNPQCARLGIEQSASPGDPCGDNDNWQIGYAATADDPTLASTDAWAWNAGNGDQSCTNVPGAAKQLCNLFDKFPELKPGANVTLPSSTGDFCSADSAAMVALTAARTKSEQDAALARAASDLAAAAAREVDDAIAARTAADRDVDQKTQAVQIAANAKITADTAHANAQAAATAASIKLAASTAALQDADRKVSTCAKNQSDANDAKAKADLAVNTTAQVAVNAAQTKNTADAALASAQADWNAAKAKLAASTAAAQAATATVSTCSKNASDAAAAKTRADQDVATTTQAAANAANAKIAADADLANAQTALNAANTKLAASTTTAQTAAAKVSTCSKNASDAAAAKTQADQNVTTTTQAATNAAYAKTAADNDLRNAKWAQDEAEDELEDAKRWARYHPSQEATRYVAQKQYKKDLADQKVATCTQKATDAANAKVAADAAKSKALSDQTTCANAKKAADDALVKANQEATAANSQLTKDTDDYNAKSATVTTCSKKATDCKNAKDAADAAKSKAFSDQTTCANAKKAADDALAKANQDAATANSQLSKDTDDTNAKDVKVRECTKSATDAATAKAAADDAANKARAEQTTCANAKNAADAAKAKADQEYTAAKSQCDRDDDDAKTKAAVASTCAKTAQDTANAKVAADVSLATAKTKQQEAVHNCSAKLTAQANADHAAAVAKAAAEASAADVRAKEAACAAQKPSGTVGGDGNTGSNNGAIVSSKPSSYSEAILRVYTRQQLDAYFNTVDNYKQQVTTQILATAISTAGPGKKCKPATQVPRLANDFGTRTKSIALTRVSNSSDSYLLGRMEAMRNTVNKTNIPHGGALGIACAEHYSTDSANATSLWSMSWRARLVPCNFEDNSNVRLITECGGETGVLGEQFQRELNYGIAKEWKH